MSTFGKGSFVLACAANGIGRVLIGETQLAVVAILGLTSLILVGMSYTLTLRTKKRRATVRVTPERFEVHGADGIAAIVSRIRSALPVVRVAPNDASEVHVVEVELQSRLRRIGARDISDVITIEVPDASSAGVLARSIGSATSRVEAELAGPRRRLLHPVIALASYLFSMIVLGAFSAARVFDGALTFLYGLPASAVVAIAIFEISKRIAAPPSVLIGDDAVLVRSGLGQRLIARRDVAAARYLDDDRALVIELRDGRRLQVRAAGLDGERLKAVAELCQPVDLSNRSHRESAFARQGRSAPDWCNDVRSAIQSTDYRSTAASVAEASDVLTSPLARGDERIGAAVALRIAGESETVRAASKAIVDKRIRRALDDVANADDDDALANAVRKL